MSVFFKAYFLISFFIIAVPVEATQSLTNMNLTNMDLKSLITESERRTRRFKNFAFFEKTILPHFSKEYLTGAYSIVTINMELSRRYFYGIGVPQNKSKFVAYSIAANSVANHYFSKAPSTSSSKNKIEEVVTKEMQEMISSIKQSQNIGAYYMSMMFLKGIEIERNLTMGLYYLKIFAGRGYKPAQILLVKIFFYGLYGIKRNNKEALYWAKRIFEGKKFDEATVLKNAASIDVELLVLKIATSVSKRAKIKLLKISNFIEEKKAAGQVLKRAKLQNEQCRKVFTRK